MASLMGNIDIWRSEEMQLVQLMIPSEAAHDTIAALGEIGMLQFKDLVPDKSAFQRTYANQVKRCDEMARKLRFLTDQVGMRYMAPPEHVHGLEGWGAASSRASNRHISQVHKANLTVVGRAPAWSERALTVDELESKLDDLEKETLEHNSNSERLLRTHSELAELQVLLEKAGQFFQSANQSAARAAVSSNVASDAQGQDNMGAPLLAPDREAGQASDYASKIGRLGFVAGLIPQQKLDSFERILFRATRGNVFVRSSSVGRVRDPSSGEQLEKSAFVVFFAGDRSKTKIMKICEAFGANRYPFPEEVPRQRQMHAEVTSRLRELHTTIEAGDMLRQTVLTTVAQNLEPWTFLVRKEKSIYHTLNKMNLDFTRKVLVAEAWVPSSATARVSEALRQAAAMSEAQVTTVMQPLPSAHQSPPTYFKSNKFTQVFQSIVDAYGVANYREVNPTVFTIMTFPFLFAVMFGDVGHGILMLLFALLLLAFEKSLMKQQLDDITSMLFGGRYCILLMALFSIYTGAIYNEFFSIPMTIFGGPSHFKCYDGSEMLPQVQLRDCGHYGGVIKREGVDNSYAFGVDPAWRGTKTELPYLNSLKMKMSILIGVTQMNLGILMSLFNNRYFRDNVSTWCEFIPQVIFLNSLFGYLSFLILLKWATGEATDLYHVLIYMFLSPGQIDPTGYAYPYQGAVQNTLLVLALVAVPWMLFPKPLILNERAKAAKRDVGGFQRMRDEEGHGQGHGGGGHGDHEEFEFGEVMIHQMIHTIEFVMSAVSNTASYLRLWALSLAHSQLSAVFYDRVLMAGIQTNVPAAIFVAFFVWALATLGVLMVMESLSAFLHALRLHWVEFNSKFYKGTGWQFQPFSFADLHLVEEH